jgi:hypothetical protein
MTNKVSDQLTECRHCGKPYCYESSVEGKSIMWQCMFCGFTTHTGMLTNTAELKATMEGLPILYRQLATPDEDGFVWIPQYRRIDGVGEIYANTVDQGVNWFWTAAPHIPMPDSEKEVYKNQDGSYRLYKADAANSKHFHNEAFVGALHFLGII